MKSYKKILTALFSTVLLSHSINAQTTLSTFEYGLTTGTKYIDTWEQSPFNIGSCVNNTVAVIDNPYSDNMNPTEKVLYFVRPYYSGDKSGVEVVLENPFIISANRQYIHVLIHKPTATRVYIEGFDGDNVSQFQSLSSSDMRPNAWSDAIFEARGNGYQIERLVIYPDVETPLGRINSDLNIYIDEIIVSSSSTPRTVVDFCRPNGTKTESRYLSELKTSNALLDLNDNFSSVPEKLYSKYNKSAIVAAPGSSFSLQFKQKSTQSTQEAWNAYVYADFNGDKEFVSSTEIIGQATSTLQDDEYIFNIDVNVPAGTPLSSCVLRIKLDDANGDNSDIASHESCSDVTDGMVLDIPLEIANYADRAIVNISGVTAQSGWGTIRILGIDGNEVKVNNGTMLTVVASPYVGYTFEGWYNASTGGLVSNEAEFTFSAEFNINLLAKFEEIPYCIPTGELPIEAWFGKIKITPENSSELYYIGSTSSEVNTINSNIQNLSILGGVNIKRNTTFNLGLVKATSSTSISAMKANVWVDWNGDHEFSADEYVSSFDLNNIDNILNITVPAENTITGNTYIRLILSDKIGRASCRERV